MFDLYALQRLLSLAGQTGDEYTRAAMVCQVAISDK